LHKPTSVFEALDDKDFTYFNLKVPDRIKQLELHTNSKQINNLFVLISKIKEINPEGIKLINLKLTSTRLDDFFRLMEEKDSILNSKFSP
jgi:hypothetical protein